MTHGARWVRVDVWSDNEGLHKYYDQAGFTLCAWCESIPAYPSAALFQKPVRDISPPAVPLVTEDPGPGQD